MVQRLPDTTDLKVRPAQAEDLEAFLALAEMFVAERQQLFDADEARRVFAHNARNDAAVHLLFAAEEAIGFSLIHAFNMPLTRVPSIRQEVVFVRKNWRSCEAEGFLHAMALFEFEALPADELSLYVCASPHALEVIDELRRIGLHDAGMRMEGVKKSVVLLRLN